MFCRLSFLALFAPLVASLTLDTPSNVVSQGQLTISWTYQPTDPPFSLFFQNTVFHDTFAISNNLQPAQGSVTLTLPVLPAGDGYTLVATNIGNLNQVYASTGDFSVAPNPSASSTASGSTASGSSGSVTSTSVTTISATGTGSVSSGVSLSTPSSGVTLTSPASSPTNTLSSPSSTSTSSSFNGAGALKMNGQVGALAAAFFSAVAGAAIFVL